MKRLVNFKFTPSDYFTANCNTATATFLQEAEYVSANGVSNKSKELKREPEQITGASLCSIGSGQRMFFWNSRLQNEIIALYIAHDYKKQPAKISKMMAELENNPTQLQKFADSKDYILQVIETWPRKQCISALEQILDSSTPLGKVFNTQRTGTWRIPHLSRGSLKKAADKLEEYNKMGLESKLQI